MTITPETFAGQMEYLHHAGFRTLTVEQLLQCVKDGADPGPRAVILGHKGGDKKQEDAIPGKSLLPFPTKLDIFITSFVIIWKKNMPV